MISAPSHSGEKANPDYYVNYNSPVKCTEVEAYGCYAWNAEKTGEEEALVKGGKECLTTSEEKCGWVSASPKERKCSEKLGACEWSDGLVEGTVYAFVTWHNDGKCGEKCPAKANYRRVTVVVTAKVPGSNKEPAPVRVSTLLTEPS
jgi:hypothetical protein